MSSFEQEEATVLLREEMEALIQERDKLLRVAGAAAVLVSNLDETVLPEDHDTLDAAESLAGFLNELDVETLTDALESVMAQPDPDAQKEAERQAQDRTNS
jgi:hypothetical protein